MKILAIDPGNAESGWVIIDAETCRPLEFGKWGNEQLRRACLLNGPFMVDHVAIEMIASYGMAVGVEVFDTCVWIGRFTEALLYATQETPTLVVRRPVKLHHCGSAKATDANIAQALKDRFAYGQPNHGKGTKADPGWFHGFFKDIWQAYALAVYLADTTSG